MDDEEGEDELEEGKIPVYPRGMLKLELGCGDGHVVRAMEYKRLSGMMLGETALGAKLRIRNVRVLRGVRECLLCLASHPTCDFGEDVTCKRRQS